jgi:hypothetical protein
MPRGHDAEYALRSERCSRAHASKHRAEWPTSELEGVAGADLGDHVRGFRLRGLDLHPPGGCCGAIAINASDSSRRSKGSRTCADANERNKGEKRPGHTVWIGRPRPSLVPSNELLEWAERPITALERPIVALSESCDCDHSQRLERTE